MGGWARGKTRGEYRFMKLMKWKKKSKITLSFSWRKKIFLYIFMKSLLHREKEYGPLFTTAQTSIIVTVLMHRLSPPPACRRYFFNFPGDGAEGMAHIQFFVK